MAKKSKAARWFELLAPHQRKCYYCDRDLVAAFGNGGWTSAAASIDHKIPKCRKPYGEEHELVLACCACNQAKSDMTSEEFHYFLATKKFSESYIEWLAAKTYKHMMRGRNK